MSAISPVSINPTPAQIAAHPSQNTQSNSDLEDRLSKPTTTLNVHLGASLILDAPVTQRTGPSSTLHQRLAAAQSNSDTAAKALGKATERIKDQRAEVTTAQANTTINTQQDQSAANGINQTPSSLS